MDLYSFQASASSALTVQTSLPSGGQAMDTFLRLFEANGTELAFNDNDPAGGLYSALQFTFPKAGTYYIGVSGANNSAYNPNVSGSGVAGSVGDDHTVVRRFLSGDTAAGRTLSDLHVVARGHMIHTPRRAVDH